MTLQLHVLMVSRNVEKMASVCLLAMMDLVLKVRIALLTNIVIWESALILSMLVNHASIKMSVDVQQLASIKMLIL